jgi:hypothetical protein
MNPPVQNPRERGHFDEAKMLVHSNITSIGTAMPHRELLTESMRLTLQTPAVDEREMVRHYTLSTEDLALIKRRRGDPNRLGFALVLCYLRFPGRVLQQGEQPPSALCSFIAEQLGVEAALFDDYAGRDQTRREHVLEIETALGFRPLTHALYREFAAWLLPTALATDHGPTLVATLLEELRTRRIVCPPLAAIERLAGSVRARAQRQLWRRLADGLTYQQRQSLDQLLEVRSGFPNPIYDLITCRESGSIEPPITALDPLPCLKLRFVSSPLQRARKFLKERSQFARWEPRCANLDCLK